MITAFITWIFRVNVAFFALLMPIFFGFSLDDESRFFRLCGSAVLLIIIFVLPAINMTAIFAKIFRKTLDKTEFLSIATVISILLVPLLVLIEVDALHILSPSLPIINAAVSFLVFSVIFHSKRSSPGPEMTLFEESAPHPTRSSFIVALAIITSSVFGIVFAYYPLPDFDPYYWFAMFQDQFAKGVISSLFSYRPLFSSLAYLFSQSAGIDLYTFFKYLLPFVVILPILPATLIARRFTRPVEQMCIFFLPFANASFCLYSTMPIPQAIFNALLVTAIFFSLHSLLSGKKMFFHIAGLILFLGFFYHEMAVIPFLAWMIPFLLFERARLIHFAKNNLLVSTLILLIVISNLSFLFPMFSYVASWGANIAELIFSSHPNFAFPAQYVNIDGNSVGWQDVAGVIRYYAFYFGPAALVMLGFLPLILRRPETRNFLKREETLFLLISAGVFLLMSDVFPRLFNVALLPERALGFASLFVLAFTPLLFTALHGRKSVIFRFIPTLLLMAFLINLGAALYINDLKKYLITPSQLISAEWIKAQLPEDRVIFSVGNRRLLRLHANSVVAEVDDPAFYSDEMIFEKTVRDYDPEDPDRINMVRRQLAEISDALSDLSNRKVSDSAEFLAGIRKESSEIENVKRLVEEAGEDVEDGPSSEYYIYYAAPSEKNPYIDRPYMPKVAGEGVDFIFDRNPDRFRMIYSDTENGIYIWEIL